MSTALKGMESWRRKVPFRQSLRGSNNLRGGQRQFGSSVLINNWFADRLSQQVEPHTSWAVSHRVSQSPTPSNFLRKTTYVQSYDYGDWSRKPVTLSKYGLLGHDDSGTETWITESRFEYINPTIRKNKLKELKAWPYEGSVYPEAVHGEVKFHSQPVASGITRQPEHKQSFTSPSQLDLVHERNSADRDKARNMTQTKLGTAYNCSIPARESKVQQTNLRER